MSLPFYTYPGNRNRRVAGLRAQRRFPESAAEWVSAFGASIGAAPIALWSFQDLASPILDLVGDQDLVQNQALLYAQAGDPYPANDPRLALQLDTSDTGEFAASADVAFGDLPGDEQRTLVVRFRHPDTATVVRGLMGTGASTSAARWGIILNGSGALVARAGDGTTTINANGGIADDNLFHDAALVWDPVVADTLGALLDGNALVSTALGALAAVDAATGIRAGACLGLPAQTGAQISWAGLFDYAWTAAMMTTFRAFR